VEKSRRGRVETSAVLPGAMRPRQTVTSQIGAGFWETAVTAPVMKRMTSS